MDDAFTDVNRPVLHLPNDCLILFHFNAASDRVELLHVHLLLRRKHGVWIGSLLYDRDANRQTNTCVHKP